MVDTQIAEGSPSVPRSIESGILRSPTRPTGSDELQCDIPVSRLPSGYTLLLSARGRRANYPITSRQFSPREVIVPARRVNRREAEPRPRTRWRSRRRVKRESTDGCRFAGQREERERRGEERRGRRGPGGGGIKKQQLLPRDRVGRVVYDEKRKQTEGRYRTRPLYLSALFL